VTSVIFRHVNRSCYLLTYHIISCFTKIHIGLTFLVPAYPGCRGKEAVKCVCQHWSYRQQISKFYTQIQNTEACFYISDKPLANI